MAWKTATFKDQRVWVECDAWGAPLIEDGRRKIRYSDRAGSTIYKASASRIEDHASEPRELPEGSEAATPSGPPGARPVVASPASATGSAARPGRGSGFGSAGSRTVAQAAAAQVHATAQVSAASDAIRCFTDGSCKGNPGPAGSGLLACFPDGRRVERHRALGFATNNVGELTAIAMALDLLDEENVRPQTPVVVFSDSQYARGVLTLNWKAKANVELIAGLRARLKKRPGVSLQWVAGHVGLPENERADELAGRGMEESRRMGR